MSFKVSREYPLQINFFAFLSTARGKSLVQELTALGFYIRNLLPLNYTWWRKKLISVQSLSLIFRLSNHHHPPLTVILSRLTIQEIHRLPICVLYPNTALYLITIIVPRPTCHAICLRDSRINHHHSCIPCTVPNYFNFFFFSLSSFSRTMNFQFNPQPTANDPPPPFPPVPISLIPTTKLAARQNLFLALETITTFSRLLLLTHSLTN